MTKAKKLTAAAEHARRSSAVDGYIAALDHRYKPLVAALREVVLSAHEEIEEGLKWNAPSFWRGEWFGTFHLRSKDGLMVVLHRGAKLKSGPENCEISDPDKLLRWLGDNRCTITFKDSDDVKRRLPALKMLIEQWSRKVAEEADKVVNR
jgi:hypothetical protein